VPSRTLVSCRGGVGPWADEIFLVVVVVGFRGFNIKKVVSKGNGASGGVLRILFYSSLGHWRTATQPLTPQDSGR
jgi:hypothetical protein